MKIIETLDVYFSLAKDKRKTAYVTYELSDILFLIACGMICGCTELERLLEFAELRKKSQRIQHILSRRRNFHGIEKRDS